MRQWLAASVLSTSGTATRLTLQAANAAGCSIDGMYIGHQAGAGDAYDFDGGQVQVMVGGSGSFSISAASAVVTDTIAFALDETKNLIIAIHFNSTSSVRGKDSMGASATNYYKSAADETATSNVSTYSNTPLALRLVNLIEVLV
jgi:hypothetical protein